MFLVLLVGVYLLRDQLLAGPLARVASNVLSDQLGGRFELERVEGNWFGDLELVGMRTDESPSVGALQRVSFDRIRVTYDLMTLLGERPQDGIESVTVSGLDLKLDLTAPTEESTEPPPSLADIVDALPRSFPEMTINGRVEVLTADGSMILGDLRVAGGSQELALTLREIEPLPTLRDGAPESLTLTLARLPERTWQLSLDEEVWGLKIEAARVGLGQDDALQAELAATFAEGSLRASLNQGQLSANLESLKIAAAPAWLNRLMEGVSGIPNQGTLSAKAQSRITSDPLTATFELQALDLGWPQVVGGQATLRGRLA
ncbi:MAG: hypothetical protein KDB53_03340, partial [Planctomycetes bacterium]|nr:hypothetical protein [Planctomycetota bacterium]